MSFIWKNSRGLYIVILKGNLSMKVGEYVEYSVFSFTETFRITIGIAIIIRKFGKPWSCFDISGVDKNFVENAIYYIAICICSDEIITNNLKNYVYQNIRKPSVKFKTWLVVLQHRTLVIDRKVAPIFKY